MITIITCTRDRKAYNEKSALTNKSRYFVEGWKSNLLIRLLRSAQFSYFYLDYVLDNIAHLQLEILETKKNFEALRIGAKTHGRVTLIRMRK